jgi:lauroyl/myristoyl acyltransferase
MPSSFTFDERGFKRQIEKLANEAVRNIAAQAQPKLDAVFNAHQGQPVNEVIPPLRATFTEMGWTMTEDELRAYAEAISGGQRIVLSPDPVT